jgi:hypothetical protein
MSVSCCETGKYLICGMPGCRDLGGNEPVIFFCPWCGTKLDEEHTTDENGNKYPILPQRQEMPNYTTDENGNEYPI